MKFFWDKKLFATLLLAVLLSVSFALPASAARRTTGTTQRSGSFSRPSAPSAPRRSTPSISRPPSRRAAPAVTSPTRRSSQPVHSSGSVNATPRRATTPSFTRTTPSPVPSYTPPRSNGGTVIIAPEIEIESAPTAPIYTTQPNHGSAPIYTGEPTDLNINWGLVLKFIGFGVLGLFLVWAIISGVNALNAHTEAKKQEEQTRLLDQMMVIQIELGLLAVMPGIKALLNRTYEEIDTSNGESSAVLWGVTEVFEHVLRFSENLSHGYAQGYQYNFEEVEDKYNYLATHLRTQIDETHYAVNGVVHRRAASEVHDDPGSHYVVAVLLGLPYNEDLKYAVKEAKTTEGMRRLLTKIVAKSDDVQVATLLISPDPTMGDGMSSDEFLVSFPELKVLT